MRKTLMMIAALTFANSPALAEIDGHGPDAWRVTGVAADDVLNMRMGPGTDYLVIDHLAPDARGLQQVTCVPLLIQPYHSALSDAQRAALPQRWCLMRSADLSKAGWVAQRFLAEDTLRDTLNPAPDPVSSPGAESDSNPMAVLTGRFMQGYTVMDSQQILEKIETELKPRQSVFLPHADISPLALAILALEAAEGARDRVRYRITWGIEPLPNPPKYSPLPVSFIQIDRFSLGARIRDEAIASYGTGNIPPPEEFDAGPHVSWRLVTSPVMGIRADIQAIGRTELSDAQAADMSCLSSACLYTAMSINDAVPWGDMKETRPDLDMRYMSRRGDLLTPAAAIDLLTGDRVFADFSDTERQRGTPDVPAPFLEAVIEVNLAQDIIMDAALRLGDQMDDSIAAIWRRLAALPTDQGIPGPKIYRAETYECHRGPKFPARGGLCP